MNVLLVGNRAIQHALAVRLRHEGCAVDVYPGQDVDAYRAVTAHQILEREYDLVVLGSARYFEDESVQILRQKGVPFFGPDRNAAQLETSKERFKAFARQYEIPTPSSRMFAVYQDAVDHLKGLSPPYVIKADGPARGCGVTICWSLAEAEQDLFRKLKDTASVYFAGRVVVEEFVEGFEVAVNVFLDDSTFVVLPTTKPHKRRDVGDTGPLVAGMGSVAPVRLNRAFYDALRDTIVRPTLAALREEGWYFRGCLFINLMVTDHEVTVLEYNCRMGDPAMLVDLLLLKSSARELLMAVAENRLDGVTSVFHDAVAVAVTLTDRGYPDDGLAARTVALEAKDWLGVGADAGLVIAGAGQAGASRMLNVNNGVVACAVAMGPEFESARQEAYRLAQCVPGLHYRPDIGHSLRPPAKYAA